MRLPSADDARSYSTDLHAAYVQSIESALKDALPSA